MMMMMVAMIVYFQKSELHIKQEPVDVSQDIRYDSSDTDNSDADDEDYVYEDRKVTRSKVMFNVFDNVYKIHSNNFVLGEGGKEHKI